MLKRTMDAEFLNAVINDPTVRSRYDWEGALDLEDYIAEPNVLAFVAPNGGFLFKEVLPNMWDAHVMFRRPTKGRYVRAHCREMMALMFTQYDAIALHLAVRRDNWPALRLARDLRFQTMGFKQQQFNGAFCEVEHLGLTKEVWRPN